MTTTDKENTMPTTSHAAMAAAAFDVWADALDSAAAAANVSAEVGARCAASDAAWFAFIGTGDRFASAELTADTYAAAAAYITYADAASAADAAYKIAVASASGWDAEILIYDAKRLREIAIAAAAARYAAATE